MTMASAKYFLYVAAPCLLVIVAGCGGDQQRSGSGPNPEAGVLRAKAPEPIASSAPREWYNSELLTNAGFNDDLGGNNIGPWNVTHEGKGPGYLRALSGKKGHGPFIGVVSGDVELRQTVENVNNEVAGALVSASVDLVVNPDNTATLEVRYTDEDGEHVVASADASPHEGKEFRTVEASGALPNDTWITSLHFVVQFSGPNAKHIDNCSLTVKPSSTS